MTPWGLHALAGVFAVAMLVRHLPRALPLLLRGGARERPGAIASAVNVLLAAGILAFAVKGLVTGLISR